VFGTKNVADDPSKPTNIPPALREALATVEQKDVDLVRNGLYIYIYIFIYIYIYIYNIYIYNIYIYIYI
jgi:hypothetical protein